MVISDNLEHAKETVIAFNKESNFARSETGEVNHIHFMWVEAPHNGKGPVNGVGGSVNGG